LKLRLLTSTSAVELLDLVGGTQLLFHRPFSHQLLKVIDRMVEQGEREARRGVVSPGNRGFPGAGKRRELPPLLVFVQFRAGRQGRDSDRENSLPPSWPP
jgi:hypothetical protein